METLIYKCTASVTSNWPNKTESVMDLATKPRFSTYNNLTYVGRATNGGYREDIFQIGDNTNYYLRIGKMSSDTTRESAANIDANISRSGDTSVTNSYVVSNHISTTDRINWSGGGVIANFTQYLITDDNNNIKVLWATFPTISTRTIQNPIIFTKSNAGRDIIIIFSGNSESSNDAPSVFFMDDSNGARYYVNNDQRRFSSNDKVLKITGIPIVTSDGGTNVIDSVNSEFVQIINTDLGSVNGNPYYNSAAYGRKLIHIGSKYYRQLTSNWWFEDPKGDETPIVITENTYPSV